MAWETPISEGCGVEDSVESLGGEEKPRVPSTLQHPWEQPGEAARTLVPLPGAKEGQTDTCTHLETEHSLTGKNPQKQHRYHNPVLVQNMTSTPEL